MSKKELGVKFKFNPFSGVIEEDLLELIIPKFNMVNLATKIEKSKEIIVEFIGKRGRGKTTHLMYLQQQLNEYPIFLLNAGASFSSIIKHPSKTVFVDSIHHLSFKERIILFKTKDKVIYTTHWKRNIAGLLAQKKIYSMAFKGINVGLLKNILNTRLLFASSFVLDEGMLFTEKEVAFLIKKFGDNYRGIINYLYEEYLWKKE